MKKTTFIIRDEVPPEERTPLVPDDVKKLVKLLGHKVYVISAKHREVELADEKYKEAGATIIDVKDFQDVFREISDSDDKCIFLGVKDAQNI